MNALNFISKTGGISRRAKLVALAVLLFIGVCMNLDRAAAQSRFDASDWHVPPPMPPTGPPTGGSGSAGKPIVLTIFDITPVPLPFTPPVKLPGLGNIGTTAPDADVPDQPVLASLGGQDVPAPGAPDAPGLSQQTPNDVSTSEFADVPSPESPELPAAPSEPKPTGQVNFIKQTIPVMPGVISLPPPSTPPDNKGQSSWPTPALPVDENIKISKPEKIKSTKANSKNRQKTKPQ